MDDDDDARMMIDCITNLYVDTMATEIGCARYYVRLGLYETKEKRQMIG
jgi:hypothetical protein